jgi:hypothetical protein
VSGIYVTHCSFLELKTSFIDRDSLSTLFNFEFLTIRESRCEPAGPNDRGLINPKYHIADPHNFTLFTS